jgi:uncharacterized protein (TIGR03067 family)
VFAFSCLAALAVAGAGPKDSASSDLQRLQGIWEVVSLGDSGETWPPLARTFVMIYGHQLATAGHELGGIAKADFEINPRQRTVDLLWQGRLLGIYQLDGDRLTVCVASSKDRPESFAPDKDRWLFRLRRLPGGGDRLRAQASLADADEVAKEKLKAIRDRLPGLMKRAGFTCRQHPGSDGEERYEIRCVRRTGPTQAKVVIGWRFHWPAGLGDDDQQTFLTIQLRFCDGMWTTTKCEGAGRNNFFPEGQVGELMAAIDEIADHLAQGK